MPLRFRPVMLVLALSGVLLALRPEPVQAQGLFDVIRGIFGGRGFVVPEDEPKSAPYQAYCVRLCDGRFFPLPAAERSERERERERERDRGPSGYNRSRGFFFHEYREERRPTARTSGDASAESLCKAMCPATPVKVFAGNGIDYATSSDGAPYSKLQNAFVYREKMIPECTCTGIDNTGLENLDPETDPTLQPGDIVVTTEGVKIYRGGRGQASLVPVNEARGMPETVRRNLSAIQIRRTPEAVTARAGIPPEAPADPAKPSTTPANAMPTVAAP